jgi:hypothetical protein
VSWIAGPVEQGPTIFNPSWINVHVPPTAKVHKRFDVGLVVLINDILWRYALLFCGNGDWGAMLIRSGNHENSVAHCSLKPILDVWWEIASCYVAEMKRAVGVRPSHANQHVFLSH